MRPRWKGAAGVLAEAVAELVGSGRWWARRGGKGRSPEPVVVELRGGEPHDVQELMKRLAEYRTRMPINNPDVFADTEDGQTPTVAELLDDVAEWYSYPGMCKRRRPMRFRRFRMAQKAYEAWTRPGNCGAAQVKQLQQQCERAAYDERGGLLHELNRLRGRAVQDDMKAAALLYGTGSFLAGLTLVPLAEWIIRHRWVHQPARKWFQDKLNAPTPTAMYLALCQVRNQGTDAWDQWLMDAFLADINAYYHQGRRLNSSRLPLLLVPHAEPGRPGAEFLRHLRGSQTGIAVPRRSSPVVVAHTGAGQHDEIVITDAVIAGARAGDSAFELPEVPVDDGSGERLRLSGSGPVANAVSAGVLICLVAAGLSIGPTVSGGLACDQGLTLWPRLLQRDGQCVGVTDGHAGSAFLPELAEVSRRIEAENDAAAQRKPSVAVALMLPMTPDNDPEKRQVLREVQGAYLAQYRANHGAELGAKQPAIRLILANPGREYAHWRETTDQLRDMAKDPKQRLRAVTGFNLSVKATGDALRSLTDAGIPVVGGPITADEMENKSEGGKQRFPGMARTVPTNSDQARALVNHNQRTRPEDSVLVVDTRPDDTYNSSLAAAFHKAVSPSTKPKEFESKGPNVQGNVANQFERMVGTICYGGARNIYFAGRPLHLRLFLHELAVNPCRDRNYQVITGSGASTVALHLKDEDWKELDRRDKNGERKITLQYSAAGHPEAWVKGKLGNAKEFYATMKDEMTDLQNLSEKLGPSIGGRVSWEDSRAMTAHDSIWLAATVLKRLYPGEGDAVPSLEDVSSEWRNTYADKGVPGVTGWLCLDNDGNPYNKAVSVVTLDPARKNIRFEALAWPERTPSRTCDVP